MSAISEEVRVALYDAMNVSAVTTLATGGIHHKVAPQDATDGALVVFQRISSIFTRTFGGRDLENDIWMIKAIADEDSDTTKEPQALCEEILTAIETALGSTLTLATATNRDLFIEGDIPELVETIDDREVHQHGFTLRVQSN